MWLLLSNALYYCLWTATLFMSIMVVVDVAETIRRGPSPKDELNHRFIGYLICASGWAALVVFWRV